MRILIPCEFSGIVREAFSKKGHDVWSCDLEETEIKPIGTSHHLIGDVADILHFDWDMMIAFPPCTYLTTTANRSFLNNPERWKKRLDAMMFVYDLMNRNIDKICIENPKGVISSHIRKPEQYIQPYEFGHAVSKMTGLWLKNLPLLEPTNVVKPEWKQNSDGTTYRDKRGHRYSKMHYETSSTNNPGNAKLRSKTFQGIADAMADQWG